MKIAILGWGSLLWDKNKVFDEHHREWLLDGPNLKLEFSRVSSTRNDALTLVLDLVNGVPCHVAYTTSRRKQPDVAINDLVLREGTNLANIGYTFLDESRKNGDDESLGVIRAWASKMKIDVVIWTNLKSNFEAESRVKEPFTVKSAQRHIQLLDAEGKAKASEYVWRTPSFVSTPLRDALQSSPWFVRP